MCVCENSNYQKKVVGGVSNLHMFVSSRIFCWFCFPLPSETGAYLVSMISLGGEARGISLRVCGGVASASSGAARVVVLAAWYDRRKVSTQVAAGALDGKK